MGQAPRGPGLDLIDASAPRGGPGEVSRILRAQAVHGNQLVARHLKAGAPRIAHQIRQDANPQTLQRLSAEDVIPDAILAPIRALTGQATGFLTGVTSRSDSATSAATGDADSTAAEAERRAGAQVSAEQAQGEAAARQTQTQGANAERAAQAAVAGGQAQARLLDNAVPAAEYASDPVRSAMMAPPAAPLPGDIPAATRGAPEAWNCDEAAIVGRVSSLGREIAQRAARVVRSVVPESVLQFAQRGMATLRSAVATIQQKVESAKQAVTRWIDDRLRPVREAAQRLEQYLSDRLAAARQAITEKLSQAAEAASRIWTLLKTRVSTAVNGAIEWARTGVSGLAERARRLAGRFWDALPDFIKGPLQGAAAAIAAPIALAYRAIETAQAWIERKAVWLRERLTALADRGVRWFAEKYQEVRGFVVRIRESVSQRLGDVVRKAADLGRAVYARIDALSDGRLSRWRQAAAERFAALRGEVCAATGEVAGPCVERFVPEPADPRGRSFATLTTKADITVPIEGVPVKVGAGASITIERTAKKYRAILSGEALLGVSAKLNAAGGGSGANPAGGGASGASVGGGGASGSLTVQGSLPERARALLALNGQPAGLPGVPISLGAQPQPVVAPVAPGSPPGSSATPAAPAGAGGEATGEVVEKVGVALTYEFDATADRTTCQGLGGLTAFLASQGAAQLLPAPFSSLAAAGGQSAFADQLVSVRITQASEAGVSVEGEAGGVKGSAGVRAASGSSLEFGVDEQRRRVITLTLSQSLTGEASASFAPGGITFGGLSGSLGGSQELALTYNIELDALDAKLKQALSGSVTLSTFAGMIGSLPPMVAAAIRARLACLPNASEARVSFELSNNVANLRQLAEELDTELNKGDGASASGLWNAISSFVRNPDNCYVAFSANLTLTENVLGIKGSVSAGQGPEQVAGSAELSITRGQEIVLVPETRLFPGGAALPMTAPRCDAPRVAPVVPPHEDPVRTPGGDGQTDRPPPSHGRVPQTTIPIDQARRQVQETSEQIRALVRERTGASDAEKARIDRAIADIQRQRQQALTAVVLADNPNAEVVDAARGIYRVRMVDANGQERFLYGSLSVVWQMSQVSPSVFELGAQLQSRPPQPGDLPAGTTVDTQMGVGGSGIQGRAQPFPGDIDLAETFDVLAPDARSAATATYQTIVEFVRRNSARDNIEFLRLIITGGPGRGYTLATLLDEANREQLIQQLSNLTAATGNVNTMWRARVEGGRFIEVTKILAIRALSTTSGEQLFATRESGAAFQQASFEEPGQIPSGNLGAFAEIMRTQALALLEKEKYLKAAKRAYNFCMATGNLAGMEALRPIFQTDEAQVNQQTAVLAAIAEALQPRTSSRILRRDEAQQMTRRAADAIQSQLGRNGGEALRIAADLRALADAMQTTDYGLLRADAQQHRQATGLVQQAEGLINEGVRSRVTAAIDRFVR